MNESPPPSEPNLDAKLIAPNAPAKKVLSSDEKLKLREEMLIAEEARRTSHLETKKQTKSHAPK